MNDPSGEGMLGALWGRGSGWDLVTAVTLAARPVCGTYFPQDARVRVDLGQGRLAGRRRRRAARGAPSRQAVGNPVETSVRPGCVRVRASDSRPKVVVIVAVCEEHSATDDARRGWMADGEAAIASIRPPLRSKETWAPLMGGEVLRRRCRAVPMHANGTNI